jgi:hypothetical protein
MLDEYKSLILKIVSAVAVLILVYMILRESLKIYSDMVILIDRPLDARSTRGSLNKVIQPNKIPVLIPNVGMNYSISTWLYIDSWDKVTSKNIITRNPFNMYLDRENGNLVIEVGIHNGSTSEVMVYKHFPLQKWVNIVVVVENRTVDLWLNGKLYQSRQFNNIVTNNSQVPLTIAAPRSYGGSIARTYFFKKGLRRNDVLQIFEKGPAPSNFISKLVDRLVTYIFATTA